MFDCHWIKPQQEFNKILSQEKEEQMDLMKNIRMLESGLDEAKVENDKVWDQFDALKSTKEGKRVHVLMQAVTSLRGEVTHLKLHKESAEQKMKSDRKRHELAMQDITDLNKTLRKAKADSETKVQRLESKLITAQKQ